LSVETEVSEIDRSVTVNGNPGFISRKARTTVELRDGQSFAMAGLLQTINASDVNQLPWLGQIPVLGSLFRSTSFQKRESDLVIVVTPRLVRPSSPDEKLASPLDQTRPGNDVEMFLLGMLEVDKDMLRHFRDGASIIGPYGHVIDLDLGDANAVGK
jgi:pilus assembly protein CpaC